MHHSMKHYLLSLLIVGALTLAADSVFAQGDVKTGSVLDPSEGTGGPGSTTEVASITLKREAFEKWRTGYSSAFAIILFVAVFGLANIYVKALNHIKNR